MCACVYICIILVSWQHPQFVIFKLGYTVGTMLELWEMLKTQKHFEVRGQRVKKMSSYQGERYQSKLRRFGTKITDLVKIKGGQTQEGFVSLPQVDMAKTKLRGNNLTAEAMNQAQMSKIKLCPPCSEAEVEVAKRTGRRQRQVNFFQNTNVSKSSRLSSF